MAHRKAQGVTVIEMLVVVAVVGLLLALVAPPFARLIEDQRLRAIHSQVVTDIAFARSEAILRRVPVHIAVQPESASGGACYILFADSNRVRPWSQTCDCSLAAGARCPSPLTQEIRTVVLDPALRVKFSAPIIIRHAFDPENGALVVQLGEGATPNFVSRFAIDSFIDDSRKYRAFVEYSGRVSTCAPLGSGVGGTVCPP